MATEIWYWWNRVEELQARLEVAERLLTMWDLYFTSGNAIPIERAIILGSSEVVQETKTFLARTTDNGPAVCDYCKHPKVEGGCGWHNCPHSATESGSDDD